MNLNINENIKAKLNDTGIQILKSRHSQLVKSTSYDQPFTLPSTDQDGYSIFQLWNFMQIFGPHIHLGSKMPFDATIILPDNHK